MHCKMDWNVWKIGGKNKLEAIRGKWNVKNEWKMIEKLKNSSLDKSWKWIVEKKWTKIHERNKVPPNHICLPSHGIWAMNKKLLAKWNAFEKQKNKKRKMFGWTNQNGLISNYLFGRFFALPSRFLAGFPLLPISGSWIEPKYGWW